MLNDIHQIVDEIGYIDEFLKEKIEKNKNMIDKIDKNEKVLQEKIEKICRKKLIKWK